MKHHTSRQAIQWIKAYGFMHEQPDQKKTLSMMELHEQALQENMKKFNLTHEQAVQQAKDFGFM